MRRADPGGLDGGPSGDQGSADQTHGLDAGGDFALGELNMDKARLLLQEGQSGQGKRATGARRLRTGELDHS